MSQRKLRIGVGGSAANPPHWGHIELLKKLLDSGKFDKLIWIPSGIRPDKPGAIEAEHRKKMTELMLEYVGKGDSIT
jgi:nicotinic acid mononucleotide adenylyltransferase